MRTDKIRKYVLPNIPYLFIGWACLKMGTAYRLAAGANFGEKLLGLMQTIGVAFADFSPGLDPFDWLIGFVGAVAFRLLIYFKSKNAKKYRRDEEYGSARWGGPKDIQPFVDPKFENNVILTGTELLTMNTRPKIPANARNLNACIIGSSGSGKTRFWLTPQLLQAHSSYVVVNAKGGGKVVIPEGLWLTGPIELLSNVNLHTEKNALIVFTDDFNAYPILETSFEGLNTRRCQSPISARNAENIAITGYGVFDG